MHMKRELRKNKKMAWDLLRIVNSISSAPAGPVRRLAVTTVFGLGRSDQNGYLAHVKVVAWGLR